jgi:hypothetical protein
MTPKRRNIIINHKIRLCRSSHDAHERAYRRTRARISHCSYGLSRGSIALWGRGGRVSSEVARYCLCI